MHGCKLRIESNIIERNKWVIGWEARAMQGGEKRGRDGWDRSGNDWNDRLEDLFLIGLKLRFSYRK